MKQSSHSNWRRNGNYKKSESACGDEKNFAQFQ